MNCSYLKILAVFFLLWLNGNSFAQTINPRSASDSNAETNAIDSSNSDVNSLTDTSVYKNEIANYQDSILKWKGMREFGYMTYIDSILKKRKNVRVDTVAIDQNGERKKSTQVISNNAASEGWLNSFPIKIFFWVLAIAFIGFILFKLFFSGGLFQRSKETASKEIIEEQPEQLSEYSAYNILISHAESNSDYNLSIRYLYLQSLKKLSDRDLISFSPDKTNVDYVRELSSYSHKNAFTFLTRQYEYAWYGKFNITRETYMQLKDNFISFNKKVQ